MDENNATPEEVQEVDHKLLHDQARKEIEQLKDQHAQEQKTLQEQLQKSELNHQQLNDQHKSLIESHLQLNEQHGQLQQRKNSIEQKHQDLEVNIGALQVRNKELEGYIQELEGQIKVKNSHIAALESQIGQMQESIRLSLKQTESYNKQIDWIENIKNEESKMIKKTATDEIQHLNEQHQRKIQNMIEERKKIEDEYEMKMKNIYMELDSKKSLILTLQSELQEYSTQVKLRDNQIHQLVDKVNQLQSDLATKQQDIETQTELKYRLIPENQDLKRQVQMHLSLSKKLKYESDTLLQNMAERDTELMLLREQSKSAKSVIAAKENDLQRFKQRLKLIESEYSQLKEKYQSLEDLCHGIVLNNQSSIKSSPQRKNLFKPSPSIVTKQSEQPFVIRRRSISRTVTTTSKIGSRAQDYDNISGETRNVSDDKTQEDKNQENEFIEK